MSDRRITYRRMRYSDIIAGSRLIVATTNNMLRRNNRPQMKIRITRPWPFAVHWLGTDREGAFVAFNEKGKIVGLSLALVREHEWYLADLFVQRSYQSAGVGRKLLQKALRYGEKHNCRRYSLCTFSINEQAVAIYSKMGMTPQRPILDLKRPVAPKLKDSELPVDIKLSCHELSDESMINRLSQLDRKARGIRRPEEHLFWLNSPQHHVYIYRDGRKLAGYAVASEMGHVGPIAATNPKYLRSMFFHTLNVAQSDQSKPQMCFVPGEQTEIVPKMLKSGFRIRQVLLEIGTEKIGDLSIYVPGSLAHY